MLVQESAWSERVVHAIAERVAQLGLGHPAVQGERGDDVHVVDSRIGREVEHCFDHALTHVGTAHRWQRQADVVERDRQLHAREQQLGEWVLIDRVEQRVEDRTVDVVDRIERLGAVDDAAATGWQLLETEAFTSPEHDRWRVAVHLEDESGARHQCFSFVGVRRSKAILIAPRRPAAAAWAIASS